MICTKSKSPSFGDVSSSTQAAGLASVKAVAVRVPLRPATAWCHRKENVMGKEARTALLLAASGCLLAVMVEWIIGELSSDLSELGF